MRKSTTSHVNFINKKNNPRTQKTPAPQHLVASCTSMYKTCILLYMKTHTLPLFRSGFRHFSASDHVHLTDLSSKDDIHKRPSTAPSTKPSWKAASGHQHQPVHRHDCEIGSLSNTEWWRVPSSFPRFNFFVPIDFSTETYFSTKHCPPSGVAGGAPPSRVLRRGWTSTPSGMHSGVCACHLWLHAKFPNFRVDGKIMESANVERRCIWPFLSLMKKIVEVSYRKFDVVGSRELLCSSHGWECVVK